MNREWHQSAWQWLNYLKGVNNEHHKEYNTNAVNVDLAGDVRKRDGVDPMKIKLILALIAWSVCFVLTAAYACKKDYIDGPAGACSAYMPQPEGASPAESAKWVSNEKAPGKGHQPDWETGDVKAVNAPSMVDHDQKWDESVAKEMGTVGKPISTHTFTLKGSK